MKKETQDAPATRDEPLPETLEDAAQEIAALERAAVRAWARSALLLAYARRRWFANDPGGWLAWCAGMCGISNAADACHRRLAGDMLLALRGRACFAELAQTDWVKLVALSRLPPDEVPKFMEAHPLAGTGRDALRVKVAAWLGEGAAGRQPALPGLERWLGYAEADVSRIADAMKSPETARKTADAARNVMAASVVRMAEAGDAVAIQTMRCDLADLMRQMDDVLATMPRMA